MPRALCPPRRMEGVFARLRPRSPGSPRCCRTPPVAALPAQFWASRRTERARLTAFRGAPEQATPVCCLTRTTTPARRAASGGWCPVNHITDDRDYALVESEAELLAEAATDTPAEAGAPARKAER